MPKIEVPTFFGERPKVAPRALPNEYAVKALDCKFGGGNLEAYNGVLDTNEPLDTQHKTIFRFMDWWFKWTTDVDVVVSPIVADPWNRVYFTSDSGIRVTNKEIFNGPGNLPAASYPLGVPAPQNPIAAIAINPVPLPEVDDTSDDETRFYVYTLVSEQGEEGAQSPISNQLEIKYPSSTVELTFSDEETLSGNIKTRRIYRSSTEGGVSDFYKLAEIPISQQVYKDTSSAADLGEPLESENFEPPHKDMKHLTLMPNGIMAGGYGRNVCFSEPYLLHAFPVEYQLTTDHEIVAIESVSNMILVGTKGYPWVFQGNTSDAMSGRKLSSMQACVSKRSMRNIDNLIIYASPHGLCAFTGQDVELMTADIITLEQWRELEPETIEAYYYDGKYLAFYGKAHNKAFTFDPKSGAIAFHSFGSNLGYTDLVSGDFYVRGNDPKKLAKWGQGEPLSYIWRSKEYYAYEPSFSTVYVRAKEPELVGLRIIADGQVLHDYAVGTLDTRPTRIPPRRARSWQFELYGTGEIEGVIMATSMAEVSI
ncbi:MULTISPECIES: hypothetical protein [Vibrio harveyi group]|uniref:hypothetical protein n=1 Tax=Vibrio harveyi group TaxID=717610 RepID=UPI0011101956|nr:hypothetical protein [Vibrio parahaemolyticus]MDG2761626.1 hypothetical protein [Vibrio parahaemolyticus]TMX40875.1 hypothetical protein DA098_03325 [Vibrio parahaemolyticus]TMX79820.1 hypothetical protein DA094_04875 [Vibrio parahaemolyticus]